MGNAASPSVGQHILTVALEDYFQVGAFNRWIQRGQWYRFETRLETNALKTLDLLDQYKIKATFFVLGWIADEYPELVRRAAERGHEIASKGYYHRDIRQMTPAEFREDLARARAALERAAGKTVLGYRMADAWCTPSDLWLLEVLANEGYAYDSSIAPMGRQWADDPQRRFLQANKFGDRTIWEVPLSSTQFCGMTLPIAGGNYFRQFPHWFMKRLVDRWIKNQPAHPFVMYYHAWELDPEQPRISLASLRTRIRHYRNLDQMQSRLEHYFKTYRFTSIADYLGLKLETVTPAIPHGRLRPSAIIPPPTLPDDDKQPITVVVPLYNEELILPYLGNTLKSVRRTLGSRYDVNIVLVDDGSSDGTPAALHNLFGAWPQTTIVHHPVNQGVAAAILTGIRNAPTEFVASIDCDCTYDPHELLRMIPLMTEGVDVVTASPYHPEGQVRNVPGWRLLLSKGSSFLYRRILRQKLHTFTSCFRLYRKSALEGIRLQESGFLGVAELLGKLDLQGKRIVEMPAVLEVRMLGRSKMKTVRTILGHLRLMARLAWQRLRHGAQPLREMTPSTSETPP